jgi:hypothetical protein
LCGISSKVYYGVFLLKVSVGGKAYCLREGKGDLRVAFLFFKHWFFENEK